MSTPHLTQWLKIVNWIANRVRNDIRDVIGISVPDPRIKVSCYRDYSRPTQICIRFEGLDFRMDEVDIFRPESQLALATILLEVLGKPEGE